MVYPAWAEVKLDGEFNWFIYDNRINPGYFINKHGRVRSKWDVATKIESHGYPLRLIGELFWNEGMKGALYDLLKHQKDDGLNFYPFDIVEYNGENMRTVPLIERKELLAHIAKDITDNHKINGRVVQNKGEVLAYFNEIVAQGFEGIVVKPLNSKLVFGPCDWVKIKDKDESNFPIHSIDPVRERVEIWVKTPVSGKLVGLKVCNKDKVNLQVGEMIKVEHQGILSGGGLRHPSFKGKSNEI